MLPTPALFHPMLLTSMCHFGNLHYARKERQRHRAGALASRHLGAPEHLLLLSFLPPIGSFTSPTVTSGSSFFHDRSS